MYPIFDFLSDLKIILCCFVYLFECVPDPEKFLFFQGCQQYNNTFLGKITFYQ